MSEERKTYEAGKVEISTIEYRDLIEEIAKLKAEAEKDDRKYWEQYREANKAKEELKFEQNKSEKLAEKLTLAMEFINLTKSRNISFLAFVNDKRKNEYNYE